MKSVPGGVLVALCCGAFLLGRLLQQSAQLPDAVPDLNAAKQAQSHRVLHANGQQVEKLVEVQTLTTTAVAAPAPIDPLDPAQLEKFMLETSGLLKLRPPLPPGQTGDDFLHAIPFQILSWFPRIIVYPAFVDKARCEHVIKIAHDQMYPSGLAYRPGEKGDANQQTRTSKGTFMSSSQDHEGVLSWVEERIAAVTRIPVGYGEAFNVLEYQNMQHYDSHMDSFDPKEFGPQPSQRIATVLVYLSDVEEGGETVFKKEGVQGYQREIQDWRNCDDGSFKYKPRQGDAVLFWSVDPDQEINPRALHGGCPVIKGTKWVMTKWLRNVGMEDQS